MNAKLTAALIATLIAAPSYAAQPFGRDSVYATSGEPTGKAKAEAVNRHGRDSVYATNSVLRKQEVKISNVTFRHGRA